MTVDADLLIHEKAGVCKLDSRLRPDILVWLYVD